MLKSLFKRMQHSRLQLYLFWLKVFAVVLRNKLRNHLNYLVQIEMPLKTKWVGSGLPQGQGLWVQLTWVWHKPSWRRSPLTPPQSCQNLHRTEKQTLWAQQNHMYQDPGERRSDPTRDCPGLGCQCPGISSGGLGQWWPAAGMGALSVAIHAQDLLREVTIIFITSTIVWRQVPSTHQQKTELKIY